MPDTPDDDFDSFVTPATRGADARTDRHNNPIAVAVGSGGTNQYTKALDDVGIKWEPGDPFPSNEGGASMRTIRIKGDPYEASRAILANTNAIEGWYSKKTGKDILPKYNVRNGQDFKSLPVEHQNEIINGIYQAEGGQGKIKPAQDDFDKFVSGTPAPASPEPENDFDKFVSGTPSATPQGGASIVDPTGVNGPRFLGVGEPPPVMQAPHTSSRVLDDTGEEAETIPTPKPIEFRPQSGTGGLNEGFSEAVNRVADQPPDVTGADKLLADKYKDPGTRDLGQPIHFKLGKDGDPVNAALSAIGPEYPKLNEMYKSLTGSSLINIGSELKPDAEGNFTVMPTRRSMDVLNAFAKGVSEGGPEEGLRQAQAVGAQIGAKESQAYSEAQKEAAPNIAQLEAERKQYGQTPASGRAIGQSAEGAMAEVTKTLAGVTDLAGLAPNRVSDYLNTKATIGQASASLPPLTAAGEEIQRGLPEKAAKSVMDLGYTVFELAALKKVSGLSLSQIMGIESALKNNDLPIAERAKKVAKDTANGKVLDSYMGRIMSAGMFGVPAAVQGAHTAAQGGNNYDWTDALLDTAIQGGAGAIMGGAGGPEGVAEKPLGIEAAPESGVRGNAGMAADRIIAEREARVSPEGLATNRAEQRLSNLPPADPLPAQAPPETAGAIALGGAQSRLSNLPAPAGPQLQNIPGPQIEVQPDGAKLNRWQHRDFGRVTETEDQSGVPTGKVRVIDENGAEHIIQRARGTGAGNQIAVPIRETSQARDAAEQAQENAPFKVIDRRGQRAPTSGNEAPAIPAEQANPQGVALPNEAAPSPQGATQTALAQEAVPEKPETLRLQMNQLNQAKRPAMLFTPGETVLPHRPGLVETETPVGTWVHDPSKVTADQIRTKVADGSYHELLGITEPKSGNTTQVVTSRAPDGTEVESAAVSPKNEAAQKETFQQRAPEGATVETGGNEQAQKVIGERTGIARRVEDARRGALGQGPSKPGEGISATDSVQRGRQLLADGESPESAVANFRKNGSISADAMALVRARHEELAKAANKAFDEGGQRVNDPAFQKAEKARQDWWETAVKPMQTEWHKTGMAQQGETAVDTGTFYGLYRAFKDRTGREMTRDQSARAQKLANRVAESDKAVQNTSNALQSELDKETGSGKTEGRSTSGTPPKTRTAKLEQIDVYFDRVASEARARIQARTEKAQSELSGNKGQRGAGINPVGAALDIGDYGIVGAAKLAKKGVTLAKWSADMVNEFGEEIRPQLDKILSESRRLIDDKKTQDRLASQQRTAEKVGTKTGEGTEAAGQRLKAQQTQRAESKKEIDDRVKSVRSAEQQAVDESELRARFSRGLPSSANDTRIIWDNVKRYIDQGDSFSSAKRKAATDLGVEPEQVTRTLAQKPTVKQLTDQMYRQMSDRRSARSQAEAWVRNADTPRPIKALKAVRDAMFNIKVGFGLHGTVGPVTHAGENLFHPSRYADYFTNVGRTWKAVLSRGYHEQAMQDLESDPNYITAKRAGLANDPHRAYDDYQNSAMQRILGSAGQAGNRGFDVLKIMRQDFFNSRWDKLPDSQKTPEMAQRMAQLVNHSTGAIGAKLPGGEFTHSVLFAGPLEASRWARIFKDPAEAATILGRLATGQQVSSADRYFLKSVAKQTAEFAATYGAALALNQGILIASNSKDRVNMTDPSKGDFLRFKVKGRAIEPTGGVIGAIDFLAKLGNIGAGKQDPKEGRGSRMGHAFYQYGRGKLSPIASTAADVATQADYGERPMPFSSDKEKQGKPRYSWGEYLATQQTPIPISEAVRDVNETMRNEGVPGSFRDALMRGDATKSILKGTAIGALSGSTGIRIGQEYAPRPNSQATADQKADTIKNINSLDDDELRSRGYSSQQITSMRKAAGMSQFQIDFSNVKPDQNNPTRPLDRYERMDERQRYQVRSQMEHKAFTLLQRADYLLNYAKPEDVARRQEEREALQQRIDSLGLSPSDPKADKSNKSPLQVPRISGLGLRP